MNSISQTADIGHESVAAEAERKFLELQARILVEYDRAEKRATEVRPPWADTEHSSIATMRRNGGEISTQWRSRRIGQKRFKLHLERWDTYAAETDEVTVGKMRLGGFSDDAEIFANSASAARSLAFALFELADEADRVDGKLIDAYEVKRYDANSFNIEPVADGQEFTHEIIDLPTPWSPYPLQLSRETGCDWQVSFPAPEDSVTLTKTRKTIVHLARAIALATQLNAGEGR